MANVTVTAQLSGLTATTDAAGAYTVRSPAGTYTLAVKAADCIGITLLDRVVSDSVELLDLELVPSSPTAAQQLLLYQRLVKQSVSPLIKQDLIARNQFLPRPVLCQQSFRSITERQRIPR
jgi:hypothetical protein